jgi:N4-(beta-N-acetylglucosaminyl)-L-asparaginase
MERKFFLQLASIGLGSIVLSAYKGINTNKPIVISTWDAGINANKSAWHILQEKGHALDAVEKGVMTTEEEINCCVGLGANPDRDGKVTLDASIMDHMANCGSVGFVERIKHPISVARKVMEKTPHVMLVGEGAQQFALAEGFTLEKEALSPNAASAYEKWLQKHDYQPQQNRENKGHGPFAPKHLSNGQYNHDTIAMLALDIHNHLAGSCTTSGQGFKMRGRLGDSPIIGAGLFVDGEIGAAAATGQGEDVIRIGGSHLVVELMRQGFTPETACKKALQRLIDKKGVAYCKQIQVAFIALNKQGQYGAYSLNKGFNFTIQDTATQNKLIDSKYLLS